MQMKKKISELELHQVDYFVAKAEKLNVTFYDKEVYILVDHNEGDILYSPTTNPSQAWPIIEREGIDLTYNEDSEQWMSGLRKGNKGLIYFGKTSLESSMRWYLYSIYGDEVKI